MAPEAFGAVGHISSIAGNRVVDLRRGWHHQQAGQGEKGRNVLAAERNPEHQRLGHVAAFLVTVYLLPACAPEWNDGFIGAAAHGVAALSWNYHHAVESVRLTHSLHRASQTIRTRNRWPKVRPKVGGRVRTILELVIRVRPRFPTQSHL